MTRLIGRAGRAIAAAWVWIFHDVRRDLRDLTASKPTDDDPLAP